MPETIKSIFDDECKKLKIDAQFAKEVHRYQVAFVNKNREHIEFFGGHTLGVQMVRFTSSDRSKWFDEVLETEEGPLSSRLSELEVIDYANRIVGSDTMNLSSIWLLHAIFHSKYLSDKLKHEAMIDVLLALQYKFFTSLLGHYFKFVADPGVAEATYASLSGRFLIKQYRNWYDLLRARAEEIIKPTKEGGIHYETFVKMEDDEDSQYMLNDIQGRIRDIMKNIYAEFIVVHQQGTRIHSTSAVVEHDGAEILRDKTKNLSAYTRYVHSVVTDRNSFIREELVNVICSVMSTMPESLFRKTLEYMSDNYRHRQSKDIEDLLDKTLIHSFAYLADNRELVNKNTDLAEFLSRLRGVYTSSRSTDPELFHLRETAERIVGRATQNRNDSVIASIRTGVLLYVVLRAFTMRHYSSHA
jgi:hypothetical protein